jgi:hypothetical protein
VSGEPARRQSQEAARDETPRLVDLPDGLRQTGTPADNRRPGEILDLCAAAASHTRDTYLAAQYWRLSRRIGKRKAAIAVGRFDPRDRLARLTNDCDYDDLGGDWFARRIDTDKRRDHLIRHLYDVGLRQSASPSLSAPWSTDSPRHAG